MRLALGGAEAASERLSGRTDADRLKAACEASAAVCTSLVKEKKTIAPPKLFDLTSLQRETNRIYGYTAKPVSYTHLYLVGIRAEDLNGLRVRI